MLKKFLKIFLNLFLSLQHFLNSNLYTPSPILSLHHGSQLMAHCNEYCRSLHFILGFDCS